MKRIFDLLLACVAVAAMAIPILLTALLVKLTSGAPPSIGPIELAETIRSSACPNFAA